MAKRKSKRPKRIIYRIWNSAQRAWQFPSIIATNEVEAQKRLFKKIGYDALKWRFRIRPWVRLNPQTKMFQPAFPKYVCGFEENADGFEIMTPRHKDKVFKLMQTLVQKDTEWERRQEMEQEDDDNDAEAK